MVRLRYFASLREALGTADEWLELPDGIATVAQLTAWLQARDANWQQALADRCLHTAVNQTVVTGDAPVRNGDEIAWFPPVTGG